LDDADDLDDGGGAIKNGGEMPPCLILQDPERINPGWIYRTTIMAEFDDHKALIQG
jgi:hypothetical protein